MDNHFISFPSKGMFYMSAGGTYDTKKYKEYTALVFKRSALNPSQQKLILKFMDMYREYCKLWDHLDNAGKEIALWGIIHKINWTYKNSEYVDNPKAPIDILFNCVCDLIRSNMKPLQFIKNLNYKNTREGFKLSV